MNQQTVEMLTLIFAGEAALMMTIMCILMVTRTMSARRKDQDAGNALAKEVIKSEEERQAALREAFSECYTLEDEELTKVVEEFITRERAFYKTLISIYVNRDGEQFQKLTDSLNEVVNSYTDLAKTSEPVANTEALEALEQKNEALAKELDESKDVMEGLMDEYKATFDKTGEESETETDDETVEVESEASSAEESSEDSENDQIANEEDDAIPTLDEIADPDDVEEDLGDLDDILNEVDEAESATESKVEEDEIDELVNESPAAEENGSDQSEPAPESNVENEVDTETVSTDTNDEVNEAEEPVSSDENEEEASEAQQAVAEDPVEESKEELETENSSSSGMSVDEIDALLNGGVGEIEAVEEESKDDTGADDLDIDIDAVVAEAASLDEEETSEKTDIQDDVEEAEAILDDILSELDEVSLDDIDIDIDETEAELETEEA